jgi:hypothetical protein
MKMKKLLGLAILGAVALASSPAFAWYDDGYYHHGYYGHSHYRDGIYVGVYDPAPPVYYNQPTYVVPPPQPPLILPPQQQPLQPLPPQASDGRYCREYRSSVNVGGTMKPTYGTACMQPDGSWQIMN